MGTQIALTEQATVPALLAKGKTPSLVAWAKPLQGALAVSLQETETGFADILTLPPALIPSEAQRAQITDHHRSLTSSLSETPENGDVYGVKVGAIVTKLLLTLGGQKNELASEAKGEAYSIALEDVPWWAVEAAVRSWYRRECKDENDKPFDYDWAPTPPTLRLIALRHVWRVKSEAMNAQKLLDAKPYKDCGPALDRGRCAMRTVFKAITEGPEAIAELRAIGFEEAARRGAVLPPRKDEVAA